MMPPPGLQNYIRPHVTLTFDLLIPKVDLFTLLPRGPLAPIGIKIGSFHSFVKYRVYKFGNRRTNGRTDGRTDRQIENIMPPPASLAWRSHNKE